MTAAFPSNFTAGRDPPREEWQPAPLRPPEQVAELQRDFDAFLRWRAQELRPPITTYRELYARHRPPAAPWLSTEAVRALGAGLTERPEPQIVEGHCLSPAEQWGVIVRTLAALRDGAGTGAVPVRRLLGPATAPLELVAPVEVSREALLGAAACSDAYARETGAVPAATCVPGGEIGPNALLQAGAKWLLQARDTGKAPERVVVAPVPEEPAICQRPDIAEMRIRGWSPLPPEFEGRRVLAMAQRQMWTAKPA